MCKAVVKKCDIVVKNKFAYNFMLWQWVEITKHIVRPKL